MYKIAFLNFINDIETSSICLGQLSLASILNENNFEVTIIDIPFLKKNLNIEDYFSYENITSLADYISKLDIQLIDIYSIADDYVQILYLCKLIKGLNKSIKIVLGGPQASVTARTTLNNFTCIDGIGIGEGERYICDFLKFIIEENWSSLREIKGIAFRNSENIFYGGTPKLLQNLDELPIFPIPSYMVENLRFLYLDVGRGCPFNCTFCSTNTFWHRCYRLKSAKRIVEEINFYYKEYGIKDFSFTHDLFTLNKELVIDICNAIISNNLEINWSCSSRVDTLDDELIQIMKLAGCNSIYLGIETGSVRMQKSIKKNLNISSVINLIKKLKQNKYVVTTSFIFGFPDEDYEDLSATMNLVRDLSLLNVNAIQLHQLLVYPETSLFKNYKDRLKEGIKLRSLDKDNPYEKELSEMIKNNTDLFSQYYVFDTPILKEFQGLDVYMEFIFPLLYKYLSLTYKELLKLYNYDLLEIFQQYKKAIQGKVNNSIYAVDRLIESVGDKNLSELYSFEKKQF